ncbi:DNA gyrase/topoisomerase IV subunit A [Barnesiella sp. WM24]|uniref:DNA gyrase/topoisomerase IV subunit A n=1 Tax=Barnesiella sp. WM24 TaxID=2558278 RepID=UPI001071A9AE|nr:DNA gyrase/topoisomerase IV subunit A [Barnesiella sp. WM24]TFU91802.1 DNA gyrase/topoisomerase IV subunit A [Barnesiella sp. WM24]
MSDDIDDMTLPGEEEDTSLPAESSEKGGRVTLDTTDDVVRHQLRGMYQSWFLDYASYVILERAVPHITDGLKPVQRRILHSMRTLDDGRFNKVANVVGDTMKYHPHGDASIKDALVQLGQKDLLVETQGNWGNILTGASAAAGRYIEARLSHFALEVLYSPKVTDWTVSYDGRNPEPVTLPAKFPLLLVQGVEGIAVGLSSKILPHNFNEIIDAAIAYLNGEEFVLYPDFPTGGFLDVSKYNDGERGGSVKIRAKIEKVDNRTLAITEIPFGKTTGSLSDSILKAAEKGKIKVRKVEDMTSESALILVHLLPGTSSDKAIDALYAFTDCELSVSPNCCVISENKPHFLGVSDVLRHSVDTTRDLLRRELEIQRAEIEESLHFASLERIFIEERIYKDKEFEQGESMDDVLAHIDRRLDPFKASLWREVTRDDLLKLMEIRMKRILKFNSEDADRQIANYKERIAVIDDHLAHMVRFTIDWYSRLKEKYGAPYQRRTVIRSFDNIAAAAVAEANEKLYINREEGFIGTSLKKDEYICNCSDIDDIIIFYKDGKYKVVKVQEKMFVGKNVLYVNVFKHKDERTIYNVIYQNGKGGIYYMKRFYVTGVTRDKEYDLTQGLPGSKIMWFTANPNGEAEVVKVTLKPKLRLKTLQFDVDFGELGVKGKGAQGNIVTKNEVHRFSLKEKGASTLGGREVWFDPDILRLNYEKRGTYLGEFLGTDQILVILKSGEYYMSTFAASNHYEDNILRIEKYRPGHVWTAVLYDADQQGYPYLKRFTFEPVAKRTSFIGENEKSQLIILSDEPGCRVEVTYGGADSFRGSAVVDATEFIGVKSCKAKGKRLTTFAVESIVEIEPKEVDVVDETEEEPEQAPAEDTPVEPERSDDEVRDEINGQQRIF